MDKKEEEKVTKRINELYHLSQERELTPEEVEERKQLRKKFLDNFRAAFRQQLEDTVIIDKDGKEVTSEKAKEAQRKKGLRKD
ncbi:DUF896 domain-containing protein [Lactobacillus sp. PV037]|uniref:DUF896 domain-containing protein n=1 Tax=unclassified Lactobacillus TaxID=2620435 RepID=UPI00223F6BCA|nr:MULTISPECIES: DUF896 domain-containing protein [unclassified Lactobacillus]QNQ82115.1 DUF896 domain-containing protein [Lactobacillus sp. PV012]QNQ83851.1 DUF896 domain-containing protein [Lactobacillus sp. PV037]